MGQSGGTKSIGHGWQLLIPIRGKKSDTGETLSEQSRTLTLQIPELAPESKNGSSAKSKEPEIAAPVAKDKKSKGNKELPQQSIVFSSPSDADESDDEIIEVTQAADSKPSDDVPTTSNGTSNLAGSIDPETGFGRGVGRGRIRGRGARRGGGHLPGSLRGARSANKTPGSGTSTSLSSEGDQSEGGSSGSTDYPVRLPTSDNKGSVANKPSAGVQHTAYRLPDKPNKASRSRVPPSPPPPPEWHDYRNAAPHRDKASPYIPGGYPPRQAPPHGRVSSRGGRYGGRESRGGPHRDLNTNPHRSRQEKNSSESDTSFTRAQKKARKVEQIGYGHPPKPDRGGNKKKQAAHRSDWD